MAAAAGKLFLIKVNTGTTGSPIWTSVGGLQTKSLTINNQLVEITNDDSFNIEYLAGAGLTEYSASGEAVMKDDAAMKAVMAHAAARSEDEYQVIVPNHGTFQGSFIVENFQVSGTTKAELRAQFGLKATSTITFTAS